MDSRKVSELMAELVKLQGIRGKLIARSFAAKGEQLVDSAINSVDEKIAAIGTRFAKANEKSEKRKEEKNNYKNALQNINAEFERESDAILGTIERYEGLKANAISVATVRKAALDIVDKRIRSRQRPDNKDLSSHEILELAQKQLDKDKRILESTERANEMAEQILARIDENIENQRNKHESLKKRREEQIEKLTEDREMTKQTPISRFFGFFGRGASKKVEDIQNAMNDRTAKAIEKQKGLKTEVSDNIENMGSVNRELESKIKGEIASMVEVAKAGVGLSFDRVQDVGEKIRKTVEASLSLVGNGTKAMLQKGVAAAIKNLNEFASGVDASMEKVDKAKQTLGMDSRAESI